MAHPGHPVIASAQEKRSDSRTKLNEAYYTVLVASKSTDFTAAYTEATHYLVDCSTTSGAVAVTLPDPATATNQRYSFIKVDAATAAVTISSNGATGTGNINGASSYLLSSQWDGAVLYNDGTDWYVE